MIDEPPESVEISSNLPLVGRVTAGARGILIPVLVLQIISLVAIAVIVHMDVRLDAESHRRIEMAIVESVEAQRVQNWLLSLPQDKRPPLKRPVEASKYLLDIYER